MAQVKLTQRTIREFSCPPDVAKKAGYAFLWDSVVPGLAVRCTRNGAKSFVFGAKVNGRDLRTTIGAVEHWDIESSDPKQPGAREEARRLQRLVDLGTDPREDRAARERAAERERAREQAEATRGTLTVSAAWKVYVAAGKAGKVRKGAWSELHLRDHIRLASPGGETRKRSKNLSTPGPLASLMPLKLSDLDSDRVAMWMNTEKATRPASTRLACALLRAFLRWAADQKDYREIVHGDACESRTVKDALPARRIKKDCLDKAKLKPWFANVQAISNQTTAAYLQCVLLTGARREEMASMKWADVDLKWNTLTIAGKTGERIIPLPPYCKRLIDALPRLKENDHVFASVDAKAGYLNSPNIAHAAAVERAEIPHLTIHGLRRSFATLGEELNPPGGVIMQLMGHAQSSVHEKYIVRSIDFLREWHAKIEKWMLAQAGVKVAPAKKARRVPKEAHEH
jgi:integrase